MTPVFAQVNIEREFGVSQKFPTLGSLFSVIIANIYTITGIILLFLLIFGGLSFIIGAGSGDSNKAANGKKTITAAVAGFVIIFTSYFLIQLIERITGVAILNPNL